MKETIIDNEFVSLWYYPEKKIVAHKLHKAIAGKTLRDALNKGTELLKEHSAEKWMSDDRDFSALHPADREWGNNDWNPRTRAAGWKYWAVIMPETALGQMSTRRLIQTFADLGVEVEAFATPEDALEWLDSK